MEAERVRAILQAAEDAQGEALTVTIDWLGGEGRHLLDFTAKHVPDVERDEVAFYLVQSNFEQLKKALDGSSAEDVMADYLDKLVALTLTLGCKGS